MLSPTSASRTSTGAERRPAIHGFSVDTEDAGRAARRYRLKRNRSRLAWWDVLDLWRGEDDAFRLFFIDALKSSPFACYRFETPPATAYSAGQSFEFVLLDSPEIDLKPAARDFQEHFDARPGDVLVFPNLGGDAMMIVPRPRENVPGYPHISGFMRHAPLAQQLRLWRTVGETLHGLLGDSPLWLSTAGGGVPWLHLRVDSRPKYYVFDEYRAPYGR